MRYKTIGFGLAAFAAGAAAWVVGIGKFGPNPGNRRTPRKPNPAAEHVPTDLMGDHRPKPGDRAPEAFRPDPTAVPTPEEREALRPATGPAPSFAADRGSSFEDNAGAA